MMKFEHHLQLSATYSRIRLRVIVSHHHFLRMKSAIVLRWMRASLVSWWDFRMIRMWLTT